MSIPRSCVSLLALVFVALPGCSKPKPAPVAQASAAPSAKPAAAPAKPAGFDLAGTVRGKPVEFRSAVVAKRPHSDALVLLVSTQPRTCKDLEGSYSLSQGESLFEITIAQGIASPTWRVASTEYDGSSMLGGNTDADIKVAAGDPSQTVRITLGKIALKGFKSDDKLEAHGTIVARGCGTVAERVTGPAAPGPARPQPDLDVTVGGKKLTIVAANYMAKDKRIILSTSPLGCLTSYSAADASLLLDANGKKVSVQGYRVGGGYYDVEPKPKPHIKLGPKSGGKIKATFKGAFKRDDLPVAISGSAELAVCP